MLKINTYTDFGQFVAALKAAEKLDLRYTVERRWVAATRRLRVFELRTDGKPANEPVDASYIEYTLTIFPDETAEEAHQQTA